VTPPQSKARERVLAEAERLFTEKGYAAVTLRDIAKAVGIRHASLYHHVPGGKEALFIEVTEKGLARHVAGMETYLQKATIDIESQLRAVAYWLVSQPPIDLIRMSRSDMEALPPETARRLMQLTYQSLFQPISNVLKAAQHRGEIQHHNLDLIAPVFFSMIQALHAIPPFAIETTLEDLTDEIVKVLLNGLHTQAV